MTATLSHLPAARVEMARQYRDLCARSLEAWSLYKTDLGDQYDRQIAALKSRMPKDLFEQLDREMVERAVQLGEITQAQDILAFSRDIAWRQIGVMKGQRSAHGFVQLKEWMDLYEYRDRVHEGMRKVRELRARLPRVELSRPTAGDVMRQAEG